MAHLNKLLFRQGYMWV